MCGISGVFSSEPIKSRKIEQSIAQIEHRGPDERGFYLDTFCQLGMCRLAIIDVQNGKQPNFNSTKSVISVFNGEIYNFEKLHELLECKGIRVPTSGDSVLIPYLYQEFGLDFVKLLEGMFAIAIYDKEKKSLHLIRDRFGEKPLWYSKVNGIVYFVSEIKGLRAFGLDFQLDTSRISEFIRYGYIGAPRSAILGVRSVKPASIVTFEEQGESFLNYWNVSSEDLSDISYQEAKFEAKKLIRNSVEARLISERPSGIFLSGGIDSTIVAAIAKDLSQGDIHTFTIGFKDQRYDESKFSRVVAKELGTIHHERYFDVNLETYLFELVKKVDQPFADSSIIPTMFLSAFASEEVVVALGGDGGDEVFGGYDRYRASVYGRKLGVSRVLDVVPAALSARIDNQKIRKLLEFRAGPTLSQSYRNLVSLCQDELLHSILHNNLEDEDFFEELWNQCNDENDLRRLQELDLKTYLSDDLLYKVDTASMAYGLEVRSPFLDHRIVEFGLSIPTEFKINLFQGKVLLRDIASEFVPRNLIDRPKKGFSVPRNDWLRNELGNLVDESLLDSSARSKEWFTPGSIEKLIEKHKSGHNMDYILWPVLMLELWCRNWLNH